MGVSSHFFINLFGCMELLSASPFTCIKGRALLSSRVCLPTEALCMVF